MINSFIDMKELLEVFYNPGPLFASLNERKGAWIVPLIADSVLLLLMNVLVTRYIGMENIIRQQLEGFNMPPEQMQAALQTANSPARLYGSYASAFFGASIFLLVVSGALLVFSMMTSKQPRFKAMFSMVAIAFFPYWLVALVMTSLVLIISPDPSSLDVRNLVATNVGAFVDKSTLPKGLYSLLSSLDILSFAEIGLLGYGFSKLTRSSIFGGIGAVLVLWVLYVAGKMAISSIF